MISSNTNKVTRTDKNGRFNVAFPNGERFTSSIASSSVFTRITDSTGPKISSFAIVISGVTLSKIVGPRKKPSF